MTKAAATIATDRIVIVPLADIEGLWWPDPAPVAVQRVSAESSARLIAVIGRLFGDVKILHELENAGRLPEPAQQYASRYFGSVLHVLHSGTDDLTGSLPRPVVEYLARYVIDDEQEHAAWKRAAHEFNRRLNINEQRAFLVAVRDRLQDVGANVARYRAKVRAFDAWLSRVEDWLRGGAK